MSTNYDHLKDEDLLLAAEGNLLPDAAADHLSKCAACAGEVASLRDTCGFIGTAPRINLSDTLRARVMKSYTDRTESRSMIIRMLTWRMPLYQAAGFAVLCMLLWQLLIPFGPTSTINEVEIPQGFIFAAGESLIGP